MRRKAPAWAIQLQNDVRIIMALVSVDQASIDALASQLEDVKNVLAAALADLAALEPPAPAPAP